MSDARANPKRSDPIRLAVYMLAGAAIGLVFFAPLVGNMQDPWFQASPLVDGLGGAVAGLAVELLRRLLSEAMDHNPGAGRPSDRAHTG
jgi:hypothetical protein